MAVAVERPPSHDVPSLPGPVVAAQEPKSSPPVAFLAVLGGVILVFVAYVMVRWVTGPYFERVPKGASDPPSWMQAELIAWQALSIPAAAFAVWRCIVRPWRRDGRVGVDGVLVFAFCSLWFQDVLSDAGQPWFTYNSSMLNFGSWASSVPGWASFGKPGAMVSEPILFTPFAYVYAVFLAAMAGSAVMRQIRRRRPQTSALQLVVLCYAAMCAFDIVLEGIVWQPLGIFEYPGGHWSIFPSTYHKYPLNELLTVSAAFTFMAGLRFFVNDRGETFAERGIEQLRLSPGRSFAVRALAVTAAVQLAWLVTYTVPNTYVGLNSTAWPADLQKRSYFLNGLCGAGTDRPCPGPGVPVIRRGGAYVNVRGGVTRGDHALPVIVPLDRGKPGGSG